MRSRPETLSPARAARPVLAALSLFLVIAMLALPGCNTVRGFGEDVSALGHALSKSSGTAGEAR